RNAERLEVSPQMGATDILQVSAGQSDEEIAAEVRKTLGGQKPDLVIECVGHREQVVNLCLEICKEHGSVFFFGVPTQTLQEISLYKLFWKNITLYASVVPDFEIDFPLAMRWIAEGRVDVSPIITHHMQLKDIQEAFEVFSQRQDGALKVFLDFPAKNT
ncbi:MAG: zinc-binding dehydrogenase, partial [Planctomycetaceae bacterium]|nr:zinc-binding dehydrogenase [Planctomycetaceae bacterium]